MKNNMLFLIDGSSLLSSSFYGNLPNSYKFAKTDEDKDMALKDILQTSDGVYTNGILTMFRSIENLLSKINPSYMAVAWDLSRNTFRKAMYEGYKSNRKTTRPELASQFIIAQEMMSEMGMPSYVFQDYEADDIIGTLARKFEDDVRVVILTKDQDALQLIDDNVSVWLITSKAEEMYAERGINYKDFNLIKGVFEYTPLTFQDIYGISPIQIIDQKALIGDSSDNIPGVKGVGEKAVIPLLQEFGTVEDIYDYIENTPANEVKEFFKELGIKRSPVSYLLKEKSSPEDICGKECALLCKKLATIKTDIEELQSIALDDLEVNIDESKKNSVYAKYELTSLIKKK